MSGSLRSLGRNFQIRFHFAAQHERHGVPVAVACTTCRDTNPSLTDAVFFNIRLFGTVETDAYPAFQQRRVVIRAARVIGEAVRKRGCHRSLYKCSVTQRANASKGML